MNDTLSIGALLPLLLALTLPSASALAQRREPVAPIVKGELGARLDAYMTRLSAFGMSGSLLVDFARNRTGFEVSALPLSPPNYSVPAGEPGKPDPDTVREFLKREFPDAPPITGNE